MPKYGYLVVEGPQDVEFVYRLLSPLGMRRIRLEADVDPFLSPLIPHDYPPKGDLQKRMPGAGSLWLVPGVVRTFVQPSGIAIGFLLWLNPIFAAMRRTLNAASLF